MTWRLRKADLDDCDAIKALIQASVRTIGLEDYTPAQIEQALTSAWGLDTQLIKDGSYWVAERKSDLIACGGWSFRKTLFGNNQEKNRDSERIDPSTGAAKVRAFFVHPAFARQGLGTRILETCEQEARDYGFTRLELMATLPGERLYRRFGYRPEGAIDYPLGDGLTIRFVAMSKYLE